MRILIVDDSAVNLRLLRAQLEAEGHAVTDARDGAEALALLGREPVDAVISDVLMPNLDGFGLCLEVRKNERLRALPFIIYTSTYTSPSDMNLAKSVGADRYLTKPAPVPLLLEALRDAVQRGDRERPPPHLAEVSVFKQYNSALVAKLEEKNAELERANADLRAGAERTRLQSAALEASANAIIITDRNGQIEWVNPAFTRLTGYAPQDAIGKNPRALLKSGKHDQAFYREMWETIQAGRVWQGEIVNRRKDGSLYPEEMTITPVRDAAGGITHFIAIKLDITERKQSIKTLEESEQRFRQMAEAIDEVFYMTNADNSELLYASPACEKIWGWTVRQIRDRPSIWSDSLHPEDRERVLDQMEKARHGGKGLSLEYRIIRPDGAVRWIRDRTTPIADSEGRIFRVAGIGEDMTERKRSEQEREALHATAEKLARELQITFDSLDFPVLLIENDGRIVRMNQAAQELSGRVSRDNIGHSLPGEKSRFPWTRTIHLVQEAVAKKGSASAQLGDDSSGRIWNCLATCFLYPERPEHGVIFTAIEITNLVKLQESLRRGEVMSTMGALVSGVAHEVRNPLFGILATLDAFQANHGDKPEFREYLDILRSESSRLSRLMNDLLDYGRPPSLTRSRGSAAAMFGQAVEANRALAEKLGVTIDLQIPPDLPKLNFDPQRLGQVFLNLLDNAIHHSAAGKAVQLRVGISPDRSALECAVLDSGPGIKPDDIPRLFQPFFTRRTGGTGLGLSLCQRIVEQHGGTIGAANRPEGGAEFIVRLPAADPSD